MVDSIGNSKTPELMHYRSAELGLTSLVFGVVVFLASPIALVLAALVWQFADESPKVVLLHAWLARVGVCCVLAVGLSGLGFAIAGLRSARSRNHSAGMALGGLLLGSAACVLWIIAGIGLLNTTESLLRLYGK